MWHVENTIISFMKILHDVCLSLVYYLYYRFKGSELFLDFVGEKSRSYKKEDKDKKLNPLRLFVCGLAPGVTKVDTLFILLSNRLFNLLLFT